MRFCEAVRDLRERGHLIEVTRAVEPVHELAAHVMRSASWPRAAPARRRPAAARLRAERFPFYLFVL
ncbi:MAG: hypothetical protein A3I01_02080 [Betaproteobacteria bacterium RIFCSPLOWO2_02_FULL_65_24]|nr:MAG: hypothetical protein A3I01_02080 [Betaproteobacteria bacterium RIFCSPLOWO2_02_FULL_65_24]